MRKILGVLACVCLVSCGSAKEIGELKDALTDEPNSIATATPTTVPQAKKDAFEEYRKIAKGMNREEVILILGDPSKAEKKTFCDSGKCSEYEYLSWLFNNGKIGVTIQGGVATFTYCQ